MSHTRKAGIAALIFCSLLFVAGSPGAQTMNDLQAELQKVLQQLAESVREAGNQWRQTLRLDPSAAETPLTFMLDHKDGLELSTEQIDDLKKLRGRFEREAIRREADIKIARMELKELLDAEPVDLAKTEEKVRQLERLRGDDKLSRIRTVEAAKALLRPDQLENLALLRGEGSVN